MTPTASASTLKNTEGLPQRWPGPRGLVVRWILLGLLLVAVYWRVPGFPLVSLDDVDNTIAHPALVSPTVESLRTIWAEPYRNMYAPLAYSVWWVWAATFGVNTPEFARASHLTNLALHWVSVCAVYVLMLRLTGPKWRHKGAFLGAAVFAVHPLAVEPVAWVSGLRDTLAVCLSLLSITALTTGTERTPRRISIPAITIACLLGAAAMLAKPSAVVLPLMLFAWWRLLHRPVRQIAPALLLLAAAAVATSIIASAAQTAGAVEPISLWARPIVAMDACAWYLGHLAAPAKLSIDHGRLPTAVLTAAHALLAGGALLLLAVVAVASRKLRWAMLMGLAGLAPVLGLVMFDFQRHSTVAERYAYPAMLAVASVVCLIARSGRLWRYGLILWAGMLGYTAHLATRAWESSPRLYATALQHNPGSILAGNGLALIRAAAGDDVSAEALFLSVLKHRPADPVTQANLGQFYLARGRPAEARQQLEAAAEQFPENPSVWNGLGMSRAMTGNLPAARQALERATTLAPTNAEALINLATVERALGNRAKSRELAQSALQLLPADDPRRAMVMELLQ